MHLLFQKRFILEHKHYQFTIICNTALYNTFTAKFPDL